MLQKLKYISKYRGRNPWRLLNGSKWVTAGIIIFNPEDQIPLIRHRWRRGEWEYPAGVSAGMESPLEAARREAREEVGLTVKNPTLLGVDFFHRRTPNGNLMFTFAAHVTAAQASQVKANLLEVTEYRWVSRPEALEIIAPRLKARLGQLLKAHDTQTPVYIQTGQTA